MTAQLIPFPAPEPRERAILDIAADMGTRLDRMVAIKMTAFPDHWSPEERREAAEKALFGQDGAA